MTLKARDSKRKRADVLPIRRDTAARLRGLFSCKLPEARAFSCPVVTNFARMLRDDLKDAGIPAVVRRQGVEYQIDFHALRHTCGGMLRRAGVSQRDAQGRMRHSNPALTAAIYQNLADLQHEADVIEGMPSLEPDVKATGTV